MPHPLQPSKHRAAVALRPIISIVWPIISLTIICCFLSFDSAVAVAVQPQTPQDPQLVRWSRFRGDLGTGVAADSLLPTAWTADDYAWSVDLPGVGASSPSVWGERMFLTSGNPETAQLTVHCLSTRTGKEQWRQSFESKSHRRHRKNTFASASIAVDENHLYLAYANQEQTWLVALTHDGEQRWKRDFGRYVSAHGFALSPIVCQDMVILANSQQAERLRGSTAPGKSRVIAVGADDGTDRWEAALTTTRVCYSVPTIHQASNGKAQIIGCNTGDGFYSIDPETGDFNWRTGNTFSKRIVSSPVLVGDMVYCTNGSGGGGNYLVAIKLDSDSCQSPPEEVFRIQNASYVSSPIVVQGRLYMFTDRGIISCHDASTGEMFWQLRAAKGFSGSPVATQDAVYCIDEEGKVHVVKVGKKKQHQIADHLNQRSHSSPVIAGNQLYLRSDSKLVAVAGKRQP